MIETQAGKISKVQATVRPRLRISAQDILIHAFLMVFLILFMFPFFWMISSSLKSLQDIYVRPVPLFPPHPTLQSYLEVLGMVKSDVLAARGGITMGRALANSAIVATTYTLGSVFLSSLAGYAFAKMRFKGRGVLFIIMLTTMMIPASVGLIPNYMIMAKLKWVNTWWPLIIPGLATPFSVFWMRQYITSVPDEMIEAAQIDGAGPFGIYWRVVLPVILPGLAALTIFSFMANWNAFMAPLIYLSDSMKYTVPIFLSLVNSSFQGQPVPLHLVFAGSLISILPILILYLTAQRYFVAGLTAGSVK